jgi:hypothetical protein
MACSDLMARSGQPSNSQVIGTLGVAAVSAIADSCLCASGGDVAGNAVLSFFLILTTGWAILATARPEWFRLLRERATRDMVVRLVLAVASYYQQVRGHRAQRQRAPVTPSASNDVEAGVRPGGDGIRVVGVGSTASISSDGSPMPRPRRDRGGRAELHKSLPSVYLLEFQSVLRVPDANEDDEEEDAAAAAAAFDPATPDPYLDPTEEEVFFGWDTRYFIFSRRCGNGLAFSRSLRLLTSLLPYTAFVW